MYTITHRIILEPQTIVDGAYGLPRCEWKVEECLVGSSITTGQLPLVNPTMFGMYKDLRVEHVTGMD